MVREKKGRNPANLLWHQAKFAYESKNKPMPYKYYKTQFDKLKNFKNDGWDITEPLKNLENYYKKNGLPEGESGRKTSTRTKAPPKPQAVTPPIIPIEPRKKFVPPAEKKKRQQTSFISTPIRFRKLLRAASGKGEVYKRILRNLPLTADQYNSFNDFLHDKKPHLTGMIKAYQHEAISKKKTRADRYFNNKQEESEEPDVGIAKEGPEVETIHSKGTVSNKDELKSLFRNIKKNYGQMNTNLDQLNDDMDNVYNSNVKLNDNLKELGNIIYN